MLLCYVIEIAIIDEMTVRQRRNTNLYEFNGTGTKTKINLEETAVTKSIMRRKEK